MIFCFFVFPNNTGRYIHYTRSAVKVFRVEEIRWSVKQEGNCLSQEVIEVVVWWVSSPHSNNIMEREREEGARD